MPSFDPYCKAGVGIARRTDLYLRPEVAKKNFISFYDLCWISDAGSVNCTRQCESIARIAKGL